MAAARRALPVWGFKEQLLEAVRDHPVVIVSGGEACGCVRCNVRCIGVCVVF